MEDQLLLKYLTGKCSVDELREIEEWICADKKNAANLFEMEQIWSLKSEIKYSDPKVLNSAYHRFENRIKRKPVLFSWWKYAAAGIIISLLSVNLYYLIRPGKSGTMNMIEVPKGQSITLTLSDGTRVWVNSESKFTYPSAFTPDNRNVQLEGEAYFEVTRNEKSPFIVQSGLLNIKVLGTKFNVEAYPEETTVVSLVEGSVEVKTADNRHQLTLKPNEQAFSSQLGELEFKKSTDTDLHAQWRSGEMYFENKRLKDITKTLERKYNTPIVIADRNLENEIFNCHTQANATLEQVLNLLKETRKIDYKIKKDSIYILKTN